MKNDICVYTPGIWMNYNNMNQHEIG